MLQPLSAQPRQKNRELEFQAGPLFLAIREAIESGVRIILAEGGVRSGKTYAIAQTKIEELHDIEKFPKGVKIEIVRKTMPALRSTAMEDFFSIMREYDLYDDDKHHKTQETYRHGKNSVTFFSVDDEQKIRGRKRDILWINEANELTHDEFKQLALRTTSYIIMDFNPPEEDHWIVEHIMTRDDVFYIHSDYTCNPFLQTEIVREIEMMQDADPNYWNVFGLGLRPIKGTRIYSHEVLVDDFDEERMDEVIYGIDFGFNKPSAVVRVGIKERIHVWDELLYTAGLTNSDLKRELHKMRKAGLITSEMQGYADTAEPDRIEELNRDSYDDILGEDIPGFNIKKADKAVKPGIDYVKGRPLHITKRSLNIIKEKKLYSWKTTKDGTILDEPVKTNDHAMDAGRYAEYSHGKALAEGDIRIRLL